MFTNAIVNRRQRPHRHPTPKANLDSAVVDTRAVEDAEEKDAAKEVDAAKVVVAAKDGGEAVTAVVEAVARAEDTDRATTSARTTTTTTMPNKLRRDSPPPKIRRPRPPMSSQPPCRLRPSQACRPSEMSELPRERGPKRRTQPPLQLLQQRSHPRQPRFQPRLPLPPQTWRNRSMPPHRHLLFQPLLQSHHLLPPPRWWLRWGHPERMQPPRLRPPLLAQAMSGPRAGRHTSFKPKNPNLPPPSHNNHRRRSLPNPYSPSPLHQRQQQQRLRNRHLRHLKRWLHLQWHHQQQRRLPSPPHPRCKRGSNKRHRHPPPRWRHSPRRLRHRPPLSGHPNLRPKRLPDPPLGLHLQSPERRPTSSTWDIGRPANRTSTTWTLDLGRLGRPMMDLSSPLRLLFPHHLRPPKNLRRSMRRRLLRPDLLRDCRSAVCPLCLPTLCWSTNSRTNSRAPPSRLPLRLLHPPRWPLQRRPPPSPITGSLTRGVRRTI